MALALPPAKRIPKEQDEQKDVELQPLIQTLDSALRRYIASFSIDYFLLHHPVKGCLYRGLANPAVTLYYASRLYQWWEHILSSRAPNCVRFIHPTKGVVYTMSDFETVSTEMQITAQDGSHLTLKHFRVLQLFHIGYSEIDITAYYNSELYPEKRRKPALCLPPAGNLYEGDCKDVRNLMQKIGQVQARSMLLFYKFRCSWIAGIDWSSLSDCRVQLLFKNDKEELVFFRELHDLHMKWRSPYRFVFYVNPISVNVRSDSLESYLGYTECEEEMDHRKCHWPAT